MSEESEIITLLTSLHGQVAAIAERIAAIEAELATQGRQACQHYQASEQRAPILDRWLGERAGVQVVLTQTVEAMDALRGQLHTTIAVVRTEHHLTRKAMTLALETADLRGNAAARRAPAGSATKRADRKKGTTAAARTGDRGPRA